jgi:hypothetical protein
VASPRDHKPLADLRLEAFFGSLPLLHPPERKRETDRVRARLQLALCKQISALGPSRGGEERRQRLRLTDGNAVTVTNLTVTNLKLRD